MKIAAFAAVFVSLSIPALCADTDDLDTEAFNRCLLEKISIAMAETTVGEIRDACLIEVQGISPPAASTPPADETTPLDERIEEIKATEGMDFVITPYKPNYILVGYNSDPNAAPFQDAFPNENIEFDATEIKFQISFMFPIVQNIFGNNGDLYFAYTNRSFWQAFNSGLSAPFRESDHEPEFWLQFNGTRRILGLNNKINAFGFVHQSNGRNEPISRSWNRLFANFIFEKGNLVFSIKPWIIVGNLDDNTDIRDYMGNIEVLGVYKWRRHTFGLMLRNNLQSGFSKGSFQVDWSFPIYHRVRFYSQYFNGYGESLIDYDVHNNTIGVGLSFTDYF